MPEKPCGAKLSKWAPSKALKASPQNMSRIRILTATMTALARADSRTPAISTPATASTTKTAGTLTLPPSPGGFAIDAGRLVPKTESRISLKYCPQPTAIAPTDSPYSSSRSQPMIQAASSPIVA